MGLAKSKTSWIDLGRMFARKSEESVVRIKREMAETENEAI